MVKRIIRQPNFSVTAPAVLLEELAGRILTRRSAQEPLARVPAGREKQGSPVTRRSQQPCQANSMGNGSNGSRQRSGDNLSIAARYSAGARSSDSNPHRLCVPSQNGWLADWPQRQSATTGLSGLMLNAFPSESVKENGPSTRNGPLGRMWIFTSAIA